MIDGLCRRWGCPPSAVLAEDARVLRMVRLLALAHPDEPGDDPVGAF